MSGHTVGLPGPVVAVVGRPNVGKSTLVNRLIGKREAIVEARPGVTRDRTAHVSQWRGRDITVLDTGGWIPGWGRTEEELDAAVAAQAEVATEQADLVVFVVDVTVGIIEEDAAIADWLRARGLEVLLVANKVDNSEIEPEIASLYALGMGEPVPVSALHGRGSGDLLDVIVDRLRERGAFGRDLKRPAEAPGVALIGRPNVGKSSLFNRILGEQRAIVHDRPGTTRDAIDTLVEVSDGRTYRFVDTAGLRRKARRGTATEYYSTVRTVQALDSAAVALLVIDASEPIGEQEQRLARQILDAGKGIVIVFNKWDLVDEDRREWVAREQDRLLGFVDFAPVVRTSAITGRSVDKLLPVIDRVLEEWRKRIPTGQLNAWLADAVAATPPPMAGGHPVKVRYVTQVATGPPNVKLFTNGTLSPGYLRYLERRLRERFGFEGSPVHLAVRVRPRWEDRAQESGGGRRGKR